MRRRFILRFVTIAILSSWSVSGQAPLDPAEPAESPNRLTLAQALEIAFQRNPLLRAANRELDALRARALQTAAWSDPELELSAEEIPVDGGGFSGAKNMVGVSQTLPFPGKKSLDRQVGDLAVRRGQAELRAQALELTREVTEAFYRALTAERIREVAADIIESGESMARLAQDRVSSGAAAFHEQLRAEVELGRIRNAHAERAARASVARQELAALLAEPNAESLRPSGTLELPPEESAAERELWAASLHPRLASAEAAREQAAFELRRANLEAWPDVRLGLAAGRNASRDEDLAEVRLALPLPVFGRTRAARLEAAANLAAASARQEAAALRIWRESQNAASRLRTASDQARRYRDEILPKAEEALELVRVGFEEGKFDLLHFIDAQRTTTEVRMAYQEALLETNLAHAAWAAAQNASVTTVGQ